MKLTTDSEKKKKYYTRDVNTTKIGLIQKNKETRLFFHSSYLDSSDGPFVENDGVIEAGVRRKLNRREREYERRAMREKGSVGGEDDPRARKGRSGCRSVAGRFSRINS